MNYRWNILQIVIVGFFVSGCASHVPTAEFTKPISDVNRLCRSDDISIKLVAADGVMLNEIYRQRLESRLIQTINEQKKVAQCQQSDKRIFVLTSKITRYDEGNAFARLLLIGLGQMHIEGDFIMYLMPATTVSIAEFNVSKTFAWGGIYGVAMHIDDLEPAFAESAADAIVAPASQNTAK